MTQSSAKFRIGSRGSPLSAAQTEAVCARLCEVHGLPRAAFEIVVIRTSGDQAGDRRLADLGGKGLFTKEIEEALLAGRIDLAVHSAKDVPTFLPRGLALAAFPFRADPRDAFVSARAKSLAALPERRRRRHRLDPARGAGAAAAAGPEDGAVARQRGHAAGEDAARRSGRHRARARGAAAARARRKSYRNSRSDAISAGGGAGRDRHRNPRERPAYGGAGGSDRRRRCRHRGQDGARVPGRARRLLPQPDRGSCRSRQRARKLLWSGDCARRKRGGGDAARRAGAATRHGSAPMRARSSARARRKARC